MSFQELLPYLDRIGWSLPLFLIAFVALWLAKAFYQWTEPFGFTDELTHQDNPAFGTALTGYLLGATIAMTGAFPTLPQPGSLAALGSAAGLFAALAVLVALLMRVSIWAIGRGVLYRFGVREEMIRDRNVGAGSVLAGGCIAAGLVLHGALSGQSDSTALIFRDVLVFWAVGLLILIGGAWLYIHVVHFDVEKVIQEGNVPAGFSLAGFLVAIGITIDAALSGAGSNLALELVLTLVVSVLALGLLVCAAIVASRVFLPHSPVSKEIAVDRNPAAGLISAGCFIAVAMLLARVIATV